VRINDVAYLARESEEAERHGVGDGGGSEMLEVLAAIKIVEVDTVRRDLVRSWW
jgi:hypothetical protein